MRISFHQLWKKGNLLCRFIFDGISAKFFCFHIFLDMRLWFSILWSYEKALTWLSQVNAFRERRALALTLNDTKTAVNKLHRMVNIMVGIVIAVIWLLILGIATSKFLLFSKFTTSPCGVHIWKHLQNCVWVYYFLVCNPSIWCGRSLWSWWSSGM